MGGRVLERFPVEHEIGLLVQSAVGIGVRVDEEVLFGLEPGARTFL
jgi:hypothetical protein